MRIWTAVLAGAGLVVLAACQATPRPITDTDRAAIRALDSAFAVAATAGDVDGMVAPYAPDALVMPQGMGIAAGQSAIREMFAGMAAAGRIRLSITTGTIEGAGDLAYATGSYELQPLPADSVQPMPPAEVGKYLGVFRRQEDGSWKMVRDMWNTNAPAAPPAGAAAPATRR
jgi:ketosteroid isomerase-like protein